MNIWKRAAGFVQPGNYAGLLTAQADRFRTRARTKQLKHLPSFFVIGPPRTGSSWLHEVLAPHTSLPAPSKETRFFDNQFHRGFSWYTSHFSKASSARCMGEVAPTYFASTEARKRISEYLPAAKVVCVFRNPVERVISLYRLKRAYGMIAWNFDQALVRDPELLESSRYVSNLQAWQKELGADQVLPVIYDDLRARPQAFLDEVVDFIGLPRFTLMPSQVRCVHSSEFLTHPRDFQRTRSATLVADWLKARHMDSFVSAVKHSPLMKLFLGGGAAFHPLPEETTRSLYRQFRPEVERLESMLNRDLTAWKSKA